VVFALPEHVVSEPLLNKDGAHLFQVHSIVPASSGAFSQVEPLVRDWLQEETESKAVERWVESLADPAEEIAIASRAELETLLEMRTLEAVVLKRGDYELHFSDLLTSEVELSADVLARRLEQLAWREKVYADAIALGWLELPHLRLSLQRAIDTHVSEFLRLEGMKQWLLDDPSRVEDYFRSQKARFSSPLTVHLHRWSLPLGGKPSKQLMLDLESRHRTAGPGGLDLEEIGQIYGGQVEDLGWLPLEHMTGRVPVGLIGALDRGETSPPYHSVDRIEIIRVVDRREPELRPLEVVHDVVVIALLAEQGQQLYRTWRQLLLDRSAFELLLEEIDRPDS
jgi:hypothetical protein